MMKKITLVITLFFCALGYSQTTLGLYTEREVTNMQTLNTAFGSNATTNNSFPTGGDDAGTDGGTQVYEVAANTDGSNTQWILNYNPRVDFTPFSTYVISLKSSSAQPTVLRIQDAADVNATLNASDYGMVYDGNWHTLFVPLADFKAAEPTINLATIKNIFLVKSDPAAAGDIVASTYVFYIDNVYLTTEVKSTLSTDSFDVSEMSIYPNPTNNQIKINYKNKIESITIYNVSGQKVLTSKGQETIDVSTLNSGVFFIKAITNGITISSKFIKQ